MGEYAEMTLNGDFCEACGEFMGDGNGNGNGYPQRCADCHHEITTAEVENEFERGMRDGKSN